MSFPSFKKIGRYFLVEGSHLYFYPIIPVVDISFFSKRYPQTSTLIRDTFYI